MAELFVLICVIVAGLGLAALLPIHLWLQRQLGGVGGPGRVLVGSDFVHTLWKLVFLSLILVNRWTNGGRFSDGVLIGLAAVVAVHPWAMVIYFSWWRFWR